MYRGGINLTKCLLVEAILVLNWLYILKPVLQISSTIYIFIRQLETEDDIYVVFVIPRRQVAQINK